MEVQSQPLCWTVDRLLSSIRESGSVGAGATLNVAELLAARSGYAVVRVSRMKVVTPPLQESQWRHSRIGHVHSRASAPKRINQVGRQVHLNITDPQPRRLSVLTQRIIMRRWIDQPVVIPYLTAKERGI